MVVGSDKAELQRIYEEKKNYHRQQARLPIEKKLAILVRLQKLAADVAMAVGRPPRPVWPSDDMSIFLD